MSSEGDSTDGIKRGSIVKHNRQSPHSKDCIIDLHLTDNPISMHFSECCQLYNDLSLTFLAGWNHLFLEDVTEAGGSMGEISSDDELHINNYLSFKKWNNNKYGSRSLHSSPFFSLMPR